jgi:hypothetical protein
MLTAIGQLATVFIGVPSIIYFAIQLREQNRERRQSAVNALTEQWGELTKALHENPEFTCFICAVFSRSMISMPCPSSALARFKTVSSRTSRDVLLAPGRHSYYGFME